MKRMKTKHMIITAGGTIEAIDAVRQIRNTSTGSLCACIYDAMADCLGKGSNHSEDCGPTYMVHYIVSATAVRPDAKETLPITFYEVTDVNSVEAMLEKLTLEYKIAYVIHGMAVSDFTKGYLIEREALVCELSDAVIKAIKDRRSSSEELHELLKKIMDKPANVLDTNDKVSSQAELFLSLNKTPKLIEKFKKLDPELFLVGFKLLKGVSEEELIQVAYEMSEKNSCDLVLANDMTKIGNGRHDGLLLKGNSVVGRYHTKEEIAAGIARHMFGIAPAALASDSGEECL